MGFVRSFFHFIRFLLITGIFLLLLIVGMGIGGFYLLDYLVTGKTVPVPNLYLKDETEAIKILAENDLTFKLGEPESRTDDEPGLVISQSHAPGTQVKRGRRITLLLSKGQDEVFIPDFTNRRITEIRSDLRSADLELGQRAAVYHPTLPADTIIAQDPISGHRILQKKAVNLLVSLGPPSIGYVMPNLIGMDLETVQKRLENEPFDLPKEDIRYERTPDVTKWFRVIAQTPPPGSRMLENDRIQLTVGSSGLEIADLRTIQVSFAIPSDVLRDNLFLVVWDDMSRQLGHPVRIDLDIPLWEDSINQSLSVMGDATGSLCKELIDPDFPTYWTLMSQFYPR